VALQHLQRARLQGPHRYEQHVALYEALGTAHGYSGNETEALAAFEQLLRMAPGHLISYTLSPKVTFLFERARELAATRRAPSVRVSWQRDQRVDKPVEIELEVLDDEAGMLKSARVFSRRRGDEEHKHLDIVLESPGAFRRAVLPPLSADAKQDEVLQLHLVGLDGRGNEVTLWGSSQQPFDVPLRYKSPPAWYEKWWVWTIVGTVAASATGVVVYAATREPPETVAGTAQVSP